MSERTIPILPCKSIDETLDFYRALGFEVTYQQQRPNTAAVVRRGEIELQFFVLKALDPANNPHSCYIITDDVDALYEAFTSGIRGAFGRVPSRGVPRVIPLKAMSYGVRQFIVIDPAGNYIRIGQPIEASGVDRSPLRLSRALTAATTLADSKDDLAAAAHVLDSAIAVEEPAPDALRFRVAVLRADVAMRMGDESLAAEFLRRADKIELSDADETALADDVRRLRELGEEQAQ